MTPCITLLYLELFPLLPHMVWRILIHPLKPSFKVRLLFLLHPLAPRAFPGHLVPPPLPACPRASYSKPTLCFHWISLSTFRTLSKLASHKWRCCKWAVCRVGGVAGRFPVNGATCCRKRIPPPQPAVSPLIHHRYNSQGNWLPGFITAVHFSWSGFFSFSLLFSCACVDGDSLVREGALGSKIERPLYLHPPCRRGVSFLKWYGRRVLRFLNICFWVS